MINERKRIMILVNYAYRLLVYFSLHKFKLKNNNLKMMQIVLIR